MENKTAKNIGLIYKAKPYLIGTHYSMGKHTQNLLAKDKQSEKTSFKINT